MGLRRTSLRFMITPCFCKQAWIIIFIALSLYAGGCQQSEIEKKLSQSDLLMIDHPDSALMILNNLHKEEVKGEEINARYNLLYIDALVRTDGKITSTDSNNFANALEYYKSDKSSKYLLRALYYDSYLNFLNFNDADSIGNVIKPVLEAYEIAIEIKDHYWEAKCEELLGDIYNSNYNTQNAAKYYGRASENFKLSSNNLKYLYSRCDYAGALSDISKSNKAKLILDSICRIACEVEKDTLLMSYSLNLLIPACYNLGDYKGVIRAFSQLQELGDTYKLTCNDYVYESLAYTSLGKINDAKTAIDFARNVCQDSDDISRINVARYAICIAEGNKSEAMALSTKIVESNSKIANNILKESPSQIITERQEQQIIDIKSKERSKEWILSAIGLGVIVILILSSFIFLKFYKKKSNLAISEYLKDIKKLEYELQMANSKMKSLEEQSQTVVRLKEENSGHKLNIINLETVIDSQKESAEVNGSLINSHVGLINNFLKNYSDQIDKLEASSSVSDAEESSSKNAKSKNNLSREQRKAIKKFRTIMENMSMGMKTKRALG